LAKYPDLSDYDLYMSGPPPMISAAKTPFLDAGLPYDRLFFNAFEFAVDVQMKIDMAEEKTRT
jgi:CDP-4-dehydro-6-deoxyglucose reductase